MIHANAFKEAVAYTQQQERTISLMPDDELDSFVIPSIETLAKEHIEPLTHAVCATIDQTVDDKLDSFLYNNGASAMVDLPIRDTLPARCSESQNDSHVDGLLLPMEGSLLKFKTIGSTRLPKSEVLTIVTSYTLADEEEAANYRVQQAEATHARIIEPEATILLPRKTIDFQRLSPYGGDIFFCSYHDSDNPNANIRTSTNSPVPPPQELRALHQAFMLEARTAVVGLRSVLQQ